jgi:hypothetical protein
MLPHVMVLLCDKMVGWDLPEFEPQTSWRHLNVFATKLHNFVLINCVHHFVLELVNYERVRKSQLCIFFKIIFYSNEASKSMIL